MIGLRIKIIKSDLTHKFKKNSSQVTLEDYKKTFIPKNKEEETKIIFEDVTKIYGNGIMAIHDLNLEINSGEFVVFLGPSGCGKTTTLRMLAGLESITSGYLRKNGAIINNVPARSRNIAMVFQNYALYPFMSVYKNISFGLEKKSKTNPAYDKVMTKLKEGYNINYEKIGLLKAEMKIMKEGSRKLVDLKLSKKRELAIYKIKKDYKNQDIVSGELMILRNKIKYGDNYRIFEKIITASSEISLLNKSSEYKDQLYKYKKLKDSLKLKIHTDLPEKTKLLKLKERYYDLKMYHKKSEELTELELGIKSLQTEIKMSVLPKFKSEIKEYKTNINAAKISLKLIFTRLKSEQPQNKILQLKSEIQSAKAELKSLPKNPKILEIKNKIKNLKIAGSIYRKENTLTLKPKINELLNERRNIIHIWNETIKYRIEEITKMLGINMYIQRKPAELSGGQRQRVALARAISKRTGLFLYDEPLSNLDAKLRAKMRLEIRELHNSFNATSVYVTHDQIEAMSMADKIVVMHKGYIQQVGSPLDLVNKPFNLFVAKFVGNTEINVFDAQFIDKCTFKIGKCKINISNRPGVANVDWEKNKNVKLTIRPEHIIIDEFLIGKTKDNLFFGTVIKSELLGNEILVILSSPELGEISVIYPSSLLVKKGDKLKFLFNPNRVGIYSGEDGYNLLEEYSNDNMLAKDAWINGREERIKNGYLLHQQKSFRTRTQKFNLLVKSLFLKSAKKERLSLKVIPKIEDEKIV